MSPAGLLSVFNQTRQVRLVSDAWLAGTLWTRMKGLIGRPAQEFTQGKGLWIVPSQGIHTFGMAFPIDAVYLDASGRVVRAYHNLAPFRIAAISFRTHSVLELPAGTLDRTSTRVGDVLEFRPNAASEV